VRLSLRYKIVGGFGLLLLLIALLGWVTLSLFGSLRDVQRRIVDDAVPSLVAADEIVRSYTAQSAAVRGYLISSRPELVQRYRDEVEVAGRWERRAESLLTGDQEARLIARLVKAGDRFQRVVDREVLPRADRGQRALAFSILGQRGDPAIEEIESLGGSLRSAQGRVMAGTEEDLQAYSTRTLVTLLLVTVGALAVGVVLAVVLPGRLVSDLKRLVDATRAIGRGDLDHKLEIRSGDEVEELASRFGEMQSGLKRLQQLALQDRELEIAASIQKNLLPRALPATPGIRVTPLQRQANLVGGDWYDVEASRTGLIVAVGDASGKGIGAAMMATVALSVLRAERGLGAGPKRVVERTNEALRDATDPDSYTTLIYAEIDSATGEARWLNMGHPSPFLVRGDSSHGDGPAGFYLEGIRNRVVGWFDEPGLEESVARLVPGDRLILFTDGFLEAKSADGETFGDHRFAEVLTKLAPLAPEAVADEVVREVERFAAGKLDDDLTMLIVEFEGSPDREGASRRSRGEEAWHSKR
jgi:serine phosphatase RsbU (regulator of sigma subunit)/CHASE3 domain sensor protein